MNHARRTLPLVLGAALATALTVAVATSPPPPAPSGLRLAAESTGPVSLSTNRASGTVMLSNQGFDIKQPSQAQRLADPETGPTYATQAFGPGPATHRPDFNLLRIPIYADGGAGVAANDHVKLAGGELHPIWANVDYQQMLDAIGAVNTVAVANNQTIPLFASLKSVKKDPDTGEAPSGGTFDKEFGQPRVDPVKYGAFLKNYVNELNTRLDSRGYDNVTLAYVGPDNEPGKYQTELDLSDLGTMNQLMTKLDEGPAFDNVKVVEDDDITPDVDRLIAYRGNQVWNDIDVAGTHFQGERHSTHADELKDFADVARGLSHPQGKTRDLPAWDNEYHFFKDGDDTSPVSPSLGATSDGVRGVFDHLESGYAGLTWWDFGACRSGLYHQCGAGSSAALDGLQQALKDALRNGQLMSGAGSVSGLGKPVVMRGIYQSGSQITLWFINPNGAPLQHQRVNLTGDDGATITAAPRAESWTWSSDADSAVIQQAQVGTVTGPIGAKYVTITELPPYSITSVAIPIG